MLYPYIKRSIWRIALFTYHNAVLLQSILMLLRPVSVHIRYKYVYKISGV